MHARLFPSRDAFCELARAGNLIPIFREIIADMETPVSAFAKIDTGEHSFLFESVEKGGKFARYSTDEPPLRQAPDSILIVPLCRWT